MALRKSFATPTSSPGWRHAPTRPVRSEPFSLVHRILAWGLPVLLIGVSTLWLLRLL